MPKKTTAPQVEDDGSEMTRFQKLARALFGVDKREVEKHEPVKRPSAKSARPQS